VRIDAQALVPSFEYFVLGGGAVTFDPTATGLNVVQAAAPDGVNGALSVTNPTLDIGTSMLGLIGHPSAPTPLGRGKCGFTRGSSLATTGRGGLPPSARDPLWSDGEPDVAPSHADRGTRDRAVAAFTANAVLGCL
jgi:hypothetical protein